MRTDPPRRLRSTSRVAKSKTARAAAQALNARQACYITADIQAGAEHPANCGL